ncbi:MULTISPECIES: SDR family NAD(P)-dependent oxidoreductase [unclassified Pseudomonas]|uniref:SDR family NAD(P)-dependent oxidoreductase n=1 Tax=unclassified Pseudomonas TaxID=196821 RepID=UPI0011A53D86|nr:MULTISPECIES: SDR family NAD(P)-dependent oxidoreductase [unclassified Pseudomonas]MBB6290699.1 NAD(P)-dependent dehydrogenase (short-subunit alcohol dehydrogenase family) [Pseudomonas sp. SJZ073]MBB6315573.1 NAD(P)-dependent dehydrogenase (short-subunit alcohol dehydrogenase family) [Pseudomonas sp. JAI120]
MFRLDDKTPVVTGVGSGIGQSIAELFAHVGAQVIVADVNLEAACAVAQRIEAVGAGRLR